MAEHRERHGSLSPFLGAFSWTIVRIARRSTVYVLSTLRCPACASRQRRCRDCPGWTSRSARSCSKIWFARKFSAWHRTEATPEEQRRQSRAITNGETSVEYKPHVVGVAARELIPIQPIPADSLRLAIGGTSDASRPLSRQSHILAAGCPACHGLEAPTGTSRTSGPRPTVRGAGMRTSRLCQSARRRLY
jgi:hypothetical protein